MNLSVIMITLITIAVIIMIGVIAVIVIINNNKGVFSISGRALLFVQT